MKKFWLSTFGECLVDGGNKGFRDIKHMLCGQSAFGYAVKQQAQQAREALARVEALQPGEETQTQGSWHPKHGATMVTVRRTA